MSTLNDAASQSGVTLLILNLRSPANWPGIHAQKLTVDEAKVGGYILPVTVASAAGSLSQIQAFLQTISGVRRFMRISSLSLTIYGAQAQAQLGLEAFCHIRLLWERLVSRLPI